MRSRLTEWWETYQTYSELTDAPYDRLSDLLLRWISDSTLPSVVLGAWLTSVVNAALGIVPTTHLVAWSLFLLLSLSLYAIGDDVKNAIQAAQEAYTPSHGFEDGYECQ